MRSRVLVNLGYLVVKVIGVAYLLFAECLDSLGRRHYERESCVVLRSTNFYKSNKKSAPSQNVVDRSEVRRGGDILSAMAPESSNNAIAIHRKNHALSAILSVAYMPGYLSSSRLNSKINTYTKRWYLVGRVGDVESGRAVLRSHNSGGGVTRATVSTATSTLFGFLASTSRPSPSSSRYCKGSFAVSWIAAGLSGGYNTGVMIEEEADHAFSMDGCSMAR
jgi:hypothetical protein